MRMHGKKGLKYAFCLAVALLIIMAFSIDTVFAESGYTTKSFDVNAKVNEDHSIDMTETITVDFNEPKHGIYRNIPYEASVYKVKSINVENENTSVSTEYSNGVSQKVIQIGDGDETITGVHTYKIKYTLAGYVDDNKSKDYFALDVLPTGWETSINSARITVTMPKDIDWTAMKVYSGSYGSTTNAENINFTYNKDGNVAILTGENISDNSGVSMRCDLPEGYWVGALDNQWVVIPMAIAIGIIPLLVFLMWLKWGRDPKLVKPVEFYPPEGLTPAEIGYIIDGTIDEKDMVSLIMYFAEKGCLSINEYEKGKFELTKLKNFSGDEKRFAITFFNALFEGGQVVNMNNLPSSFGEQYMVAREEMKSYYTGKNRLFTRGSKVCRGIGTFLMLIPAVIAVLFSAYASLKFFYALVAIPVFVLLGVGLIVAMVAFDKRDSLGKGKVFARMVIGIVLMAIAVAAASVVTGLLTGKWWIAIEIVVAMIISYLFTLLMNARTKKTAELQGKILGFKNFIKSAELDKLNALVEEDPEYFYNIMPYAYVMGLSDKWIKKFEKIPTKQPNWYVGNNPNMVFDIMWMNYMMRGCHQSMANTIISNISTQDIGSGGFGGGGFSGGGFGGGGGGAW